MIFVLLGSKSDLESKRKVSTEEVQQYVDGMEPKLDLFLEVSAKTGHNIRHAFMQIHFKLLATRKPTGAEAKSTCCCCTACFVS